MVKAKREKKEVGRVVKVNAFQSNGMKKAIPWKIALDSKRARFTCLEDNSSFDISKEEAARRIAFQSRPFIGNNDTINISTANKAWPLALTLEDNIAFASWLPPKSTTDLSKALRNWGIGLGVVGIISIFLKGIFNPVWGVVLIILGVLNFFIHQRVMFIVNGVALIVAGTFNFITSISSKSGLGGMGFWLPFGVIQIGWGITEILKYKSYSSTVK